MIASVEWPEKLRIAELGAGDGVLTRQILAQMSPDATLDAFEISSTLADKLNALNDPRHDGAHLFSGIPERRI
ncbi:Phospholipid N-methyltransferase [Pantoea agglomerans]|uniref:Phospholipid N-methyltransferase n=1 Tax=Enterobacter agglomerans TaxID=549 RepID=A0A379AH78_ENTAG|nr:Phospholipid N-methyltransferase [Pantoea agglomerans]